MHTHINSLLSPSRDPFIDNSSNFLRITGIFLDRKKVVFLRLTMMKYEGNETKNYIYLFIVENIYNQSSFVCGKSM